jgi:hypothetical protein
MSQANNHTFPVIADHPAYAARYCELCGGEVDGRGECQGGGAGCTGGEDAARIIHIMCSWSIYKPQALRVLASKMISPTDSIRDICKSYRGVTRYQVHKFLHELGQYWPGARAILGIESTTSRVQRKRRERESKCSKKQ